MFGKIDDGVWNRRGEQEKEWATCVENDARIFNIQPSWKHAPRDSQSRIKMDTEGMSYDRVEEEGRREVQIPPGE